MNHSQLANQTVAEVRRRSQLALLCVIVWASAAFLARYWGIWRSLGGVAVLLGATVTFFDRQHVCTLISLKPRKILIGLIAGMLMVACTYLLYPPLTRLVPWFVADTTRLYGAFRVASLLVASFSLVPVVIGEELVWRGVVQSSFWQRGGFIKGVVLAAVVYALAHAPLESPVLVFVAFVCGIYWGIVRLWSGGLTAPLVAHLLWDLVILLFYPLDGH